MFRKYRYGDRSQVIKKSIQTLILVIVIFTMSLGYAALSQYMEIEGMAVIENKWNVTITSVTASVTNGGVNVGSTIVGTTATLHANLPNANSTVVYTITIKNNGNVAGVLKGIEVLEDTNSNITYTITNSASELAAGATSTVEITVKYANSNVVNPLKDLMVNINYIQKTTTGTTTGTTPGTTTGTTTTPSSAGSTGGTTTKTTTKPSSAGSTGGTTTTTWPNTATAGNTTTTTTMPAT